MQRPMMDPTFVKDMVEPRAGRLAIRKWVVRACRWFWHWLLTNPFSIRRPGDDGVICSPWSVLIRTSICWAILLPVILMLGVVGLVLRGTHPAAVPALADPTSQGCYYEQVSFSSSDGTPLIGWIVPAIDARRVLDEKERLLRKPRPAIVLVHDFGHSPQQMLPLVRPLHDEGMVVLLVGLRGTGTSSPSGQTFGLREARDVAAAVNLLRASPLVDPSRIALAGSGSGASAALIDAAEDPNIKALILANAMRTCDDAVARHITPHERWLRWMQPLCRRTFELLYGVDGGQADLAQYGKLLKARPSLIFNSGDSFVLNERVAAKQVVTFCRRNLHTQDLPLLGSTR